MNNTVVFFGSGPVAAKSLKLLSEYQKIEAVITKAKVDHHRGVVPVLETATELGLPVFEVSSKKELDDLLKKKSLKSQLGILIDFGIIVSRQSIEYFPVGIVNSHFSLLPEWRGADPITFAVLSGQKTTGVSLMLLVEKMDEGPLLAQKKFDLSVETTTPTLTEELIALSDMLLKTNIDKYLRGDIIPIAQNESLKASYSNKLTKEDGIIDINKPAQQIEREIRAYQGWPSSKFKFGKLDTTITKAHVVPFKGNPGSLEVSKDSLIIACSEDGIAIDKIKPAGKNEMPIASFLAGYRSKLQ